MSAAVPSMNRTLSDAARVAGGKLLGEDHRYGAVATDSRTLKPGALFVALRGPNFDGRDFVAAAAARGAIGAIVDQAVEHGLPQVVVADALRALQTLGKAWRNEFSIPIVAVAGSNGKTTAKEMTAAMTPEAKSAMSGHIPLDRLGAPGDIAATVAFLSSEYASYITGQVLVVDGGLTM